VNEQFVRGVNLVETMYYPSSATPGHGPSPYMRDPGFPGLLRYIRRMSYLMAMGRPAADVALYLPSSSMWLGDQDADTTFVATEQLLSERQIDFDIIGEDALAADLKANHGTFETMSGNRLKTVILPGVAVLSHASYGRLRAFAEDGGHVLFLGRVPGLIYSKNILDARPATAEDFAWASVEASAQLPLTPTPPAQPPASPPAPQRVPQAVVAAVEKAVSARDITIDGPDPAWKCMKRILKDSDVYLFFNEGANPSSHTVTFRTADHVIERWDPDAGRVSSVVPTRSKGTMAVKLELKPYETAVLMVR